MNKGKKNKIGKAVSILLVICLILQPIQTYAVEKMVTTDEQAVEKVVTQQVKDAQIEMENGENHIGADAEETDNDSTDVSANSDTNERNTEQDKIDQTERASYDLSECADTLSAYVDTVYTYTGNEIVFEIPSIAFDEQTILYAGQDYTVSFESNTNAGTAKLILEGIGSNTGSREYEFTIQPFDIKDITFTLHTNGENEEQYITASYQGKNLVEGVDFEINEPSADPEVFLPIKEGKTKKAYIYIRGIGNFTGENMVSYDLDTYSEGNTARISGVSLSLNGNIGVNFYIDLSEIQELEGAYILINGQKYLVSEVPEEEVSDGIYHFMYSVAAKQIRDSIKVEVFDKEQRKVEIWNSEKNRLYEDATFVYSVKDYLDDICGYSDMSDALKTLAESLRVYGLYAQEYFQYHAEETDMTVPEIGDPIRDFQKKKEGELPAGITYKGSSLLLDSETTMKYILQMQTKR